MVFSCSVFHFKRLAAEDEEFAGEARQAFAKLEEGHQQSLQDWKICRHLHLLPFLQLNWHISFVKLVKARLLGPTLALTQGDVS